MKSSVTPTFLLIALIGSTFAAPALASGSYSGRPPKPPAQAADSATMDREKYGLGQKLYNGTVKTTERGDAEAQRPRLKAAEMKLPAETAKAKNLSTLAGKLSAPQLEALEYFIEQRYGAKK